MARMRSIKPEFFDDQDLAVELPGRDGRDARLLYIGLWGQADEHGRLRGDAAFLKGQLFAYDPDLTPEALDGLIDMLIATGRAIRYRVRSSIYLVLPKLAKHQRLEPHKVPSRLPAPPDDQPKQSKNDSSEKNPDESAPDANTYALKHVASSSKHVASSRGHTREPRPAQTAQRRTDEPPPDTQPGQAETILNNWISSLPKTPQAKIVNDVGKIVRAALAEGQDPTDITEAVRLWQARGNLGPSVLTSLIHQVANAPAASNVLALPNTRASPPRPSTTDARMQQGQAITAELEAMEARQ